MAEHDDTPLEAAFRRVFGDALADQVKDLKAKASGSINSVERERAHRQRQIDEAALRQAEEDERRRFPDR